MKSVAIMGLGLMGGSLGLAVKRRLGAHVAGYARRPEVREAALAGGVADAVFVEPGDAVAGAELVVFCVPVLTIPPLIEACRDRFADAAVVTDVGSTKDELVKMSDAVLKAERVEFVGSHPMAGSDETGLHAARETLYEGATVVVTPRDAAADASEPVRRVTEFWRAIGGNVVRMSPRQHDQIIARTSHLPHIVAAALVKSVLREEMDETARLCGTGFMDTTRIAAGSELMWHDIIKTNSATISRELALFEKELSSVRAMIDGGDFDGVRAFLAECRSRRRAAGGRTA